VFKEMKMYFILAILSFGAGYLAKTIQEPASVDRKEVHDLEAQITSLTQKLTESESNFEKMKSEQKNKKKVVIVNADGSSSTTEEESSSELVGEFYSLKSRSIEFQNEILNLKQKIEFQEEIKNNLMRADARVVFDSDRGMEYEASIGYQIFSGSGGVNPDKGSWRAGIGLGFNF